LQYRKRYEEIKDSVISDSQRPAVFVQAKRNGIKTVCSARILKRGQRTATDHRSHLRGGHTGFLPSYLRHKTKSCGLNKRAAVLEMNIAGSQMNPHFIFNCLSAINHFF